MGRGPEIESLCEARVYKMMPERVERRENVFHEEEYFVVVTCVLECPGLRWWRNIIIALSTEQGNDEWCSHWRIFTHSHYWADPSILAARTLSPSALAGENVRKCVSANLLLLNGKKRESSSFAFIPRLQMRPPRRRRRSLPLSSCARRWRWPARGGRETNC